MRQKASKANLVCNLVAYFPINIQHAAVLNENTKLK